MQDSVEFEFPPTILRNLMDKNDEKKQLAGKQLQSVIKKNSQKKNYPQIQKIIDFFKDKYVNCNDTAKKKMGIEVFEHIINGIKDSTESVNRFVQQIVRIILDCLNDNESKIRFTSLKTLYFICRKLQQEIIPIFNLIFQQMIAKINDVEEQVSNAANFLNKGLQTILSQCLPQSENLSKFHLNQLMTIVKSKIKSINPVVKQFLIKWITHLNEIVTIELMVYMPDLLEDFLFMLGEKDKNLKNTTETCLKNFRKEMSEKFNQGKLENSFNEEIINKILTVLIKMAKGKSSSYTKLETMTWFESIFDFFKRQVMMKNPKQTKKLFVKRIILERFDEVLEPILLLMSHEEEDVRKASLSTNQLLMQSISLIQDDNVINFGKVMPLLKEMLSQKKSNPTSESALRWMKFMLQNYNDKILPQINDIIEKLVEKLCQPHVKNVISVIENTRVREEYFQLLIQKMLLMLLNKAPTDAEYKPQFILRKFSTFLEPQKFCKSFCTQIVQYYCKDKKFIFDIVHHLNHLIIVEKSMANIRKKLHHCADDCDFFMVLFNAFKYNPAATTSLCLLSKQYELAYRILVTFSQDSELTSGVLAGFCKLATMIESPGFLFLRLQMLHGNTNSFLLESLTALSMILPQGKIFGMLKNRLEISKIIVPKMKESFIDVKMCLQQFRQIQQTFIDKM